MGKWAEWYEINVTRAKHGAITECRVTSDRLFYMCQNLLTNKIEYNILSILPKGLFRTKLQYEYKIMSKTTDLNYDDIHFLDLKLLLLIITNNVIIYCSCICWDVGMYNAIRTLVIQSDVNKWL